MELIAVMVVVAIIAAFAVPRMLDRKVFDARTFADQSASMIRYAQKLAIAQNREVFVRFDGASIALCFSATCNAGNATELVVVSAAGTNGGSSATLSACGNVRTWFCEAPPNGVSISTSPSIAYFYFDANGRPYAAADAIPSATSTFSTLLVRVSDGTHNFDVNVEKETGYVH